jgi:hypothetical protein
MIEQLELRTPDGLYGRVGADGHTDAPTATFLEQIVLPGGVKPGDPDYLEALYGLLRGGTALWAQLPS